MVLRLVASVIMVASIIALFNTPRINVSTNSPVVGTSPGRLMMTEHDELSYCHIVSQMPALGQQHVRTLLKWEATCMLNLTNVTENIMK